MASATSRDAHSLAATPGASSSAGSQSAPKTNQVHPFLQVAKVLGSIQLALSAGFIFTLAMVAGTCLESWYSAAIAQELIYNAWWFLLLLGILATCIFFAAVKKWPWKKHQIGFLITHVGLLTMLAGGVLNIFFGVDASMTLIDNKAFVERSRLLKANKSDEALLPHESVLVVDWMQDEASTESKNQDLLRINPGPLPWGTSLGDAIPIPAMIRNLSMLANPFSRAVDQTIFKGDLRVEVLAHLPHTRIEPLEKAGDKEFGFPAIKVEHNTRLTGHNQAEWLTLTTDRNLGQPIMLTKDGNGLIEFLGRISPALVDEFTQPPADDKQGTKGTLVFAIAGKKYNVNVAYILNQTANATLKDRPIGDSGWKLSIDDYTTNTAGPASGWPIVKATLYAPDGKTTKYLIPGREALYPGPLDHLGTPLEDLPEGLPAVWYHPPDYRYGYDEASATMNRPHLQMLLQFVQTTDNKLYYRTMMEVNGKMQLEAAGPVAGTGIPRTIWDSQAGSFLVEEYLPHAKPCFQRVIPVAQRPGLVSQTNPSAVKCRLTLTKTTSEGERKTFVKELWVPRHMVQEDPPRVTFTGTIDGKPFAETFRLTYTFKSISLGFDIELCRAESQLDPGTNRAATFTSFVKVYDPGLQMNGTDFMITMNEPLDHRGYKIYQSEFAPLRPDQTTKKPIARSGFTIGRDPGLWLKYLGTAMLGLGIATMYYMKAYFLTGKRRTPAVA